MINYSVDQDGVALLEWDAPGRSLNVLNAASTEVFADCVARALADDKVVAVLIASAKKDFIAGADLDFILTETDPAKILSLVQSWHKVLRSMEIGGKPFAAAINGSALGGGLELALACHYRVATDNARVGLPEVTLGLLPGGGGTQRLPRLIGMQAAAPFLMEGRIVRAAEAAKAGILNAVVPSGEEREIARAWLVDEGRESAVQPWDVKGAQIPGGGPATPAGIQMFLAANAMLREKSYGNYPAPRHILSCVYEGLSTNLDTGLLIESRYFANLVVSPVAKAMIRTLFFGMNEANKLARRPQGVPTQEYSKIGILGAGMMGAAIAYAAAAAGILVILLDTTVEGAKRGKGYSISLVTRRTEKGRMTRQEAEALLDRIRPTVDFDDLEGCEMVVEAVFEDRAIKADVTRKTEAVIGADAVFASNTSTLPISGLAEASGRQKNFIGLHFFSPADRMPLVEIIMGEKTSSATLARSMDFVRAIGKTPVVVNDSRGFFTTRVLGTYLNEGMQMLEEGVLPALIEKAGLIAGMPVGPLALTDEISLELGWKISQQTKADLGDAYVERAWDRVAALFVETLKRPGKRARAGFYDYPVEGRKRLWPGLADHFRSTATQPTLADLIERLIMIQSLEAVRCMEENVVKCAVDADVGAILGWGYPPFRGGPISWIDGRGIADVLHDCERLAQWHGDRFGAPKLLHDMASSGGAFYAT